MYIVDIRKLSNQLSNLVAEYAYTTTVFGIIFFTDYYENRHLL